MMKFVLEDLLMCGLLWANVEIMEDEGQAPMRQNPDTRTVREHGPRSYRRCVFGWVNTGERGSPTLMLHSGSPFNETL